MGEAVSERLSEPVMVVTLGRPGEIPAMKEAHKLKKKEAWGWTDSGEGQGEAEKAMTQTGAEAKAELELYRWKEKIVMMYGNMNKLGIGW